MLGHSGSTHLSSASSGAYYHGDSVHLHLHLYSQKIEVFCSQLDPYFIIWSGFQTADKCSCYRCQPKLKLEGIGFSPHFKNRSMDGLEKESRH